CDFIAGAGGWPVSGLRFVIRSQKAENIQVQGSPLEPDKLYYLALSDYLANGGDKLEMIKGKPFFDTQKNLRDIFIEEFSKLHQEGKQLKGYLDNRIVD
ncbi:MAG: 5'-nucleotidase C-terminal domain-containing protein, partial [Chitinophagales bacterium]|nr:5'-nucleotidase C-terminal domain-containing protein [Chitinophagales bacterium]